MKSLFSATCILFALLFMSQGVQARMPGMLGESDGEKFTIEVMGPPEKAKARVTYEASVGIPLAATVQTGLVGLSKTGEGFPLEGFSQSNEQAAGFEDLAPRQAQKGLIFSLVEDNDQLAARLERYFKEISELKQQDPDYQAKVDALSDKLLPTARVAVEFDLRSDVLAKAIKYEYLDQVYNDIVNGKLALILGFQRLKPGAYDYDLAFVDISSRGFKSKKFITVYSSPKK